MIDNLAALGYLTRHEDGDHVTLDESINELLNFRSIDPLFGAFLAKFMPRTIFEEKMQALEAVLPVPPAIERRIFRADLPAGPFQDNELDPMLIQIGAIGSNVDAGSDPDSEHSFEKADYYYEEEEQRPPTFPEKLKLVFEHRLASPEWVFVQPKWVAGAIFEYNDDFYKFVAAHDLAKNEGLILRHLLRLVILAGEFGQVAEDPSYQEIADRVTAICEHVDQRYTEKFLSDQAKQAQVKIM